MDKNIKNEILASETGKAMCRDKIQEINNEIILIRKTIRELDVKNTSVSDDQKWYLDWLIERWNDDLEQKEAELKRWKFRAMPESKRPQMSFDVDDIKQIPLGGILETPATWNSPERAQYLCPVHNEKTPSFFWYKQQNRCHCFGCGLDEDVVGLYMAMHDVDFKEACRDLQQYI
jgi:hypothetical protein